MSISHTVYLYTSFVYLYPSEISILYLHLHLNISHVRMAGLIDRSICLHRLHSAVAKFPGEFISMDDRHFSLSTLFFSSIHHIQHRHPSPFDCFILEFDPAKTPTSPQRCPPHLNRERSQSSAVDPLVRDKFPYPHDIETLALPLRHFHRLALSFCFLCV